MKLSQCIACLSLLLGAGMWFFMGCGDANGPNGGDAKPDRPAGGAGAAGMGATGSSSASGSVLYEQYCGACHLKPDPGSLTRIVWKEHVLPFMGVLMGIPSAIDSFDFSSDKDRDILNRPGNHTGHPMMSEPDWNALKGYLVSQAPDSLPYDTRRQSRNASLVQFVRQDFPLDDRRPSLVTGLGYDKASHTLWVGDLYKRVFNWQWNKGIVNTRPAHSPVVDFNFYGGQTYLTEIGMILPTELRIGAFATAGPEGDSLLLTGLHRPVQSVVEDLDGDGVPEILVCNFGNFSGSLSLFKKDRVTGRYAEQVLLAMPGAVRCIVRDMDGDGKKDIVALFAQADESVYIFYQRAPLQFQVERVLRYPPDYGTTDLILTDYNHDGLVDIVTVQGDNADYSRILKPYHGIRININQGKRGKGDKGSKGSSRIVAGDGHRPDKTPSFKEKFFYPLYGATRVIAEDFDKDGDIDFAATAFYADYDNPQDESFVYLENVGGASSFRFKSYTLAGHLPVKSFALEMADLDGDGYMDIILGNFSQSPIAVPDSLENAWKRAPYGLTVFLNQSGRLRRAAGGRHAGNGK